MAYKRISPQPVVEGGTGAQTFTTHGVLIGEGTGAVVATAAGTTGQVLTGVTGADPVFAAPAASSISITGDTGGALTGNSFTFTGGTTGLSFGGSGTTETVSGTLVVSNGGTGRATLTAHDLIIGNGTTAVTLLAPSTTSGVALVSQGASADPAYSTVVVAGGGTGQTSLTAHDLLIGNGTSAVTLLAPSATSGIPLVSQGAAADPAYSTAVVAGGGTGVTSTTAYAVICGGTTSTNPLQSIAGVGTSGQVLTSNGAAALPTFQTISTSSAAMLYSSVTNLNQTAGVRYVPIAGASSSFITIGLAQTVAPFAGVIDRLYVKATTVGSTANNTVALNVNGSTSSLSVTITASTPGTYSNLVNTVTIAQGDLLTIESSQATTAANSGLISMRFTPS